MRIQIFTLAIILAATFSDLSAQKGNLALYFSGEDAATGNSVDLQNVKIENLTQGGDTTVYGAEPYLFVSWLGIGDMPYYGEFSIGNSSPNPFSIATLFTITTETRQSIGIRIINIQGVKVCEAEEQLTQGSYTFKVTGLEAGYYILTVSNGIQTKSQKLFSQSTDKTGHARINLVGVSQNENDLKTSEAGTGFKFQPGDQLKMTATATNYEIETIFDNPTGNSSYVFELEEVSGWSCGDPFTDERDGQSYNTVQIGTQCWMAENLNIGTMMSGTGNQTDNAILEKYCYDNLASNCSNYGGLYQWDEMMQYTNEPGTEGICPPNGGWHIPTDLDWKILEGYADSQYAIGDPEWDGTGYRGLDAGKNLKSTSGWFDNGNSADLYGFSTRPGGFRSEGFFYYKSEDAFFWTSSESDGENAWYRNMWYNNLKVSRNSYQKGEGRSVRCVQSNASTTSVTFNVNMSWQAQLGNFDPGNSNLDISGTFNDWQGTPMTDSNGDQIFEVTIAGIEVWSTIEFKCRMNGAWDGTEEFPDGGPNRTYTVQPAGNNFTFWYNDEEPVSCGESFIDQRDGQEYSTVLIGTQCWMAENLNIGTMISGNQNQTNNQIFEKYCYDNLPGNCSVYGGLYQWNEMMQYTTLEGAQGICPPNGGWHIPTDDEWATLVDFLGGGPAAGGKMKEAGTIHWNPPNTGATNSSGFTALPAGSRYINSIFYELGTNAYFWSSTEYNTVNAWRQILSSQDGGINNHNDSKVSGFSVRCLK